MCFPGLLPAFSHRGCRHGRPRPPAPTCTDGQPRWLAGGSWSKICCQHLFVRSLIKTETPLYRHTRYDPPRPSPHEGSMSEAVSTGLLDRAIRRITEVWRDMASSVSGEGDETLEAQMQACLAGRGGEVSARNRAAKLAQTYLTQDEAGRKEFLRVLAR